MAENAENTVFNYAGIMAEIATRIEQGLLQNTDNIPYNAKNIKCVDDEAHTHTLYVFTEIETPKIITDDDRFNITNDITIGRRKIGNDQYEYVEYVNLNIDGYNTATFMHVSSPEVFEAAAKAYNKSIAPELPKTLASAFG